MAKKLEVYKCDICGNMVEVGLWDGGSTAYFALIFKPRKLIEKKPSLFPASTVRWERDCPCGSCWLKTIPLTRYWAFDCWIVWAIVRTSRQMGSKHWMRYVANPMMWF